MTNLIGVITYLTKRLSMKVALKVTRSIVSFKWVAGWMGWDGWCNSGVRYRAPSTVLMKYEDKGNDEYKDKCTFIFVKRNEQQR